MFIRLIKTNYFDLKKNFLRDKNPPLEGDVSVHFINVQRKMNTINLLCER